MRRSIVITFALALVLALVWVACAPSESPVAPSEQTLDPAAKPGGLGAIMAAQNRHTPALLGLEGVVGTATGLGPGGAPAILLLTVRPGVAGLPRSLDGFPVVPVVTGEIHALAKDEDRVDPTGRFDRPVPIGVSTGHPDITAGTIGCRVTDGTDVFALSNNHVYANSNAAALGDPVLQPGRVDGGTSPADDIGTLYDFEPIDFSGVVANTIDAAIALTTDILLDNATPTDGYGTPLSTTAVASIGQQVMKYGRTTGLTRASVFALNTAVEVSYGTQVALFTEQIVIRNTKGRFSAGGDSGSLIVVDGGDDDGKPVGLLFAGGRNLTIANPIDAVLGRFAVAIDGD